MSRKLFILAPVLAASTALPAFAGSVTPPPSDPVVMAPAPMPVVSSKDWTGAYVGGQLGYGNINTDDPDTEGDGALYGLRAGYDWDFGNWVAGTNLQYQGGEIELDNAAKLDGLLRLGGRAGYDAGNTLVYGTGGFAKAFTSDDAISPGDSNGYYVGLGLEQSVTENVSVGGEVNYNKFNDFDVSGMEADATTFDVFVNYRF